MKAQWEQVTSVLFTVCKFGLSSFMHMSVIYVSLGVIRWWLQQWQLTS